MANRPKNTAVKQKSDRKSASAKTSQAGRSRRHVVQGEALAVVLGCIGLLTVLSLASFDAADASFNASGRSAVNNWIGPAGAYWSDALLQLMGIGSYALGVGLLLASWRSLLGKKVLPGLREVSGLLLVVVGSGALAQLLLVSNPRPYPAGGVLGAILGNVLLENFATAGAYIVAVALLCLALAITVDGILAGLGVRGVSIINDCVGQARAVVVFLQERQKSHKARRRELLSAIDPADLPSADESVSTSWSLGQAPSLQAQKARQAERLRLVRERAQEQGAQAAEREMAMVRKRSVRERSEPELVLDAPVDLAAEEQFEMGQLPAFDDGVQAGGSLPEVDTDSGLDLELESEPEVAIRAAEHVPEPAPPEPPADDQIAIHEAPAPALDVPKRLVGGSRKSSEPQIVDARPKVDVEAIERATAEKKADAPINFELPPVSLLDFEASDREPIDPAKLRDNALRLTKTLKDYGIEGSVREIRTGPVVTMYEYVPAPGTKLSKIASLSDDLAMSMEALRVRIVAPIPGKGAVGIEIPNETRETVFFKEIIASDKFRKNKSKLTMALGKDIEGISYVADLAKMPHLLVAGATGAGKSVSVNSMIMSLLFNASPDDVRLLMVDPKMLELSVYDGIPHLLLPVVTDPKKATLALRWAVEEMERRYKSMSEVGVRNLAGYNKKVADAASGGQRLTLPPEKEGHDERTYDHLPYIVVIVDELADLMMVASRDVEACIMRLAQMARAAGIHLILATQRPSVDVLTGVIKANFPTRIAFQVASRHDSRTIIDGNGAENLLGKGDMLFLASGAAGLTRVHGAFVSDEEIERAVAFLRDQGRPEYDETILQPREGSESAQGANDEAEQDEMYDQAIAIVTESRAASISMIQRRLRIGYNRAARLVEQMELEGIVGPADGAKPRAVLAPPPPAA